MALENERRHGTVWNILVVIISMLWIPSCEGQDSNAPLVRRSDVAALSHYREIESFEAYRPTIIAWGWPLAYPKDVTTQERDNMIRTQIEEAYQQGVRIVSTNIDMVTATAWILSENPELQDAVVRDIHNEPMLVYWFEHVNYDGVPTYWGCTNHPVYREHLKEKVAKGVSFGTNALHFDDMRGSAWLDNGGCFCDFCTTAFREHLQAKYTTPELAEMGVRDIDSFNYREVVGSMFVSKEAFQRAYRNREPIPMIQVYESFLYHRASDFLNELAGVAKRVTKNSDFPISANTYNMEPRYMIGTEHLDLFVTEVDHQNHDGMEPVFAYKISDALGKRIILTANAVDWGMIKFGGNTSLVLDWIATSYAFGHQFMTPYRQWVFVNQRQTTNYMGPTDIFAPIYQFVSQNKDLLDGYEAVAQIGVVYDHSAMRQGIDTVHDVFSDLVQVNIPFEMLVAGDDWFSPRLDPSDVSSYQHIIIPDSITLLHGQQAIVEDWISNSKATYWKDTESLLKYIEPWIKVITPHNIKAVPRVKKDLTSTNPLVVHLINPVDKDIKEFQVQRDINIEVSSDLLGDRELEHVNFVSLYEEPTLLSFQSVDDRIVIAIPELTLWGILQMVVSD